MKGRTDFKIKTQKTQAVPRCHIKSSREEVRDHGLQLISSRKELTVFMYLMVWLVFGKDESVVGITGVALE